MMEAKQIILGELEKLNIQTQNQVISFVIKEIQQMRSKKYAELQTELNALKVGMEDLEKLTRESSKF